MMVSMVGMLGKVRTLRGSICSGKKLYTIVLLLLLYLSSHACCRLLTDDCDNNDAVKEWSAQWLETIASKSAF